MHDPVDMLGSAATQLRRARRRARDAAQDLLAVERRLDVVTAHHVTTERDAQNCAERLARAVQEHGPLIVTTTRAPHEGAEEDHTP
ncbi:MAG: hypothetical protein M0P31_18990 [Solirubrobacteraceae bacterium]|nr:hypothetical protein [Solirubrobacteraceae bacterium]